MKKLFAVSILSAAFLIACGGGNEQKTTPIEEIEETIEAVLEEEPISESETVTDETDEDVAEVEEVGEVQENAETENAEVDVEATEN